MISRYLNTFKNYRAALAAALFFGCITPGTKFFSQTLPPQSMAGLMYLFAGVGLFTYLLLRKTKFINLSKFQKADFKWFFLATLFGGIFGPAFLTYGIFHITSSTASLLLNLEAVLTSLIAWFIFKEHFEKQIVYGMILIVLGCIVLTLNSKSSSGSDTLIGFVLISLACLSWGIDNNVTRKISHLDPVLIAALKGLIAGSMNLYLGYLIGERFLINTEIIGIGVLGLLGIGISLVSFIVSLSSIGAARTGAIFSTAPFLGSLLSILFLNETPSWPFFTALILMVGGFWFHLSENHEHEHIHEEMEHFHEHVHDEHHQHKHAADPQSEPHSHRHKHLATIHAHPHFPDIHHQHRH